MLRKFGSGKVLRDEQDQDQKLSEKEVEELRKETTKDSDGK